MKKILFLIFLIYVPPVFSASGSGTTGAQFLNLGVSARSIAMGNAYTGVGNGGAIAANYNPAGLSGTNQSEISLMHYQYLQDSNFSYLGFTRPLGAKARTILAANVIYGSYGAVEETRVVGENGVRTGKSFTGSDNAGTISLALRASDQLGFGVNFKYIRQDIAGLRSEAPAGDIGFLYRMNSKLSFGFSVRNIGPDLKFDQNSVALPLSYNAGVSCALLKNDTLLFIADFQKLINQDPTVRFGGELNIGHQFHSEASRMPEFSLRAGQDGLREAGSGMSFGAGMRIGNYSLDYAFIPFGLLGDAHRISATMRFGKRALSSSQKS